MKKRVLAMLIAFAVMITMVSAVSVSVDSGIREVEVEQHFGTWSGSGSLSCVINAVPNDFTV